jgi:uncharacterized protein (DUF2147 family)
MKAFIFLASIFLASTVFSQSSIVGMWKTIDDETGKAKSIIEIFENEGVYNGRIIKLFREPNEDQDPKCDKCNGTLKNQRVLGMQNLNGLKKDSETKWSGGEIVDPKNGKAYSCKAELVDSGKKLNLRGFMGISLIGRTQTWERIELEAQAAPGSAVTDRPAGAVEPKAAETIPAETVKATPKAPEKVSEQNKKKK